MKKRLCYFLLFSLLIITIFSVYVITTYANVRTLNSFSVYITQNNAFAFQLRDNITQYLMINATNNAFNVTTNTLIMRNDEGHFIFTPEENSTVRITHNMDYVSIEGQNHTQEAIQLGFNTDNLGMFENEQVILIFEIKPYDVSGIVFNIFIFIISVSGLILTPPLSDIATMRKQDKEVEQMFIWVCGWLLSGMLFIMWIYL